MIEKIKKFFESKTAFRILTATGVIVVVLLVFLAGVKVGFRKASFGRDWGENYLENFGMKPGQMRYGFDDDNFPNAHGAVGTIIKAELPNIIVADDDRAEKVVLVLDDTRIEKGGAVIQATDLKVDDFVTVIGNPNQNGIIEAKLIRVIPNPDLLK